MTPGRCPPRNSGAINSTPGWRGSTSRSATEDSGLAPGLQGIVNDRLTEAKVSRINVARNVIGHGMGAPTVVAHGSEQQMERWLRPMFTAEEIWCQLFSEPGAGSDVAGLATRAVKDGDEWIVNGQKVWTTLAHTSRWGMLVARTDRRSPQASGAHLFHR